MTEKKLYGFKLCISPFAVLYFVVTYKSSETSTKGTIWTPKAPVCLLTVVMPRLPPLDKYSSLRCTAHRAATCSRPLRWTLRYTHCAGSVLVKVQCQVLNR